MGELASAVDALGAWPPTTCSGCDADLLDRTPGLAAARNMVDAELARTVRRAECAQAPEHDGLKSMKSWLRTHARLSGPAITALVTAGRVAEHLPAVAAACAAGQVTADQVGCSPRSARRRRWRRPPRPGSTCPAIEAALLAVAVSRPAPGSAEGRRRLPGRPGPRRARTRPHQQYAERRKERRRSATCRRTVHRLPGRRCRAARRQWTPSRSTAPRRGSARSSPCPLRRRCRAGRSTHRAPRPGWRRGLLTAM